MFQPIAYDQVLYRRREQRTKLISVLNNYFLTVGVVATGWPGGKHNLHIHYNSAHNNNNSRDSY